MKLTILKVKPWMIKFAIDDQIFFIKEVDDAYESVKQLYRFIPIGEHGHYETECLVGKLGHLDLTDYIGKHVHGQTYDQFDKARFWSQLAKDGFGEFVGMPSETVAFYKKHHDEIECYDKIQKLELELEYWKNRLCQLSE